MTKLQKEKAHPREMFDINVINTHDACIYCPFENSDCVYCRTCPYDD